MNSKPIASLRPAARPWKWLASKTTLLSIVIALMLLGLMACASSPPTSNRPLIAPTVNCGENDPLDLLAIAPAAPDADSPDDLVARGVGYGDLLAAYRLVYGYASSLTTWGATAAGEFQRNAIRARYTRDCINDLRRHGVIY
jgi:hypothetical protein